MGPISSLIHPLEFHPILTDPEVTAEQLAENPEFDDEAVPRPDTLHTEYVETLSRTHE